jgi:hypothetical protein
MAVQERLSLRNIYLYLVCLITLVISIFAAVNLVRSTTELLYPDPGYYGVEPFIRADGSQATLTDEERERAEQTARDSQRRQAVLGLVTSATTLLITVPVYVYHWRRIQTELPTRQSVPDGEAPVA